MDTKQFNEAVRRAVEAAEAVTAQWSEALGEFSQVFGELADELENLDGPVEDEDILTLEEKLDFIANHATWLNPSTRLLLRQNSMTRAATLKQADWIERTYERVQKERHEES